jgi:NAD(P)-dependent dehydrogenase (short-subunit alcohol dehydrogenase family)
MALNPKMRDWNGRTVWLVGASTGIGRATASSPARPGRPGGGVGPQRWCAGCLCASTPARKPCRWMPPTRRPSKASGADPGGTGCAGLRGVLRGPLPRHGAPPTSTCPTCCAITKSTTWARCICWMRCIPHLLAQAVNPSTGQRGHISLMGSVAGYRGLPNSLAYGPTKAALINLTETLYLDLRPQGVGVSLINPGFVDTPLTRQNQFKMPALITPEQAAQEILRGWAQGDFEIHFPKRFTRWMKALQLLTYPAFFAATRRLKQA